MLKLFLVLKRVPEGCWMSKMQKAKEDGNLLEVLLAAIQTKLVMAHCADFMYTSLSCRVVDQPHG